MLQGERMELFSLDIWTSNHSGLISPSHFYQTLSAFFIYVVAQVISCQYTALLHVMQCSFVFPWNRRVPVTDHPIKIFPLFGESCFQAECSEVTWLGIGARTQDKISPETLTSLKTSLLVHITFIVYRLADYC